MVNFNEGPNGGLSQEQMLYNMKNMQNNLDDKYRDFNTGNIMASVKANELKKKALNQDFDIMEQNGIDPNDPASLSDFMNRMKTENPQLYAMLEQSLNNLLADNGLNDGSPIQNGPQEPPTDPSQQVGAPGMMGGMQGSQDPTQQSMLG